MAFTKAGRELDHLRRQIEAALASPVSDTDLRAALEALAREHKAFDGFTWLWGPKLYERNKVVFRPLILGRFSTIQRVGEWQWDAVKWKGETGSILDRWLAQVDAADDIELFRRLHAWKLSGDWKAYQAKWQAELVQRFAAAATPAARTTLLAKYEAWLWFDEDAAIALYEADFTLAAPFILKHLRFGWGGDRPGVWRRLHMLAAARGDHKTADSLYRKQVKLADWQRDMLQAARDIADPARLDAELERLHPEGWGLELGDGLFELVKLRERDVLPYVKRHLRNVWSTWLRNGYDKMLDLARDREWIDLWAALVCVCSQHKEFNREVMLLLKDARLGVEEVERRLRLLSGVSREWNHAGFGLAVIHTLDDEVARKLYERFPSLVHGPFKAHVAPTWGSSQGPLLDAAIARGDDALVDFLASRHVTRSWGLSDDMARVIDKASRYYEALRLDDVAFARRASLVLTQVPSYSIRRYDELIVKNRLARLLFERSASAFLGDERALQDLVEASEIHVQHLAYRILGLDDERARRAALANLPVLIGTLLRPLHLRTRRAAFGALANAAAACGESAARVLARAREAQALPDKHYPKEDLLVLMAGVLRRHPELALEAERPVVYRRRAA